MLTQLFERFPSTVAISEPEALMPFAADKTLFAEEQTKYGSSESRSEYLKSVVEILCLSAKKRLKKDFGCLSCNVVIKPKAHAVGITSELASIFKANMTHIYLYRHPAEYVTSLKAVFNSLLHPVIHTTLIRLSFRYAYTQLCMTSGCYENCTFQDEC